MNDNVIAYRFARALVENDSSSWCDFCATGYCRNNHQPNCVVQKAKEYIKVYEECK